MSSQHRDTIRPRLADRPHANDEGELWLMSYADMVTLLLGFFVLLYSFSKTDEQSFNNMSEKIAGSLAAGKSARASVDDQPTSQEVRRLRAYEALVSMLGLGGDVEEATKRIEDAAERKAGREAFQTLLAPHARELGVGQAGGDVGNAAYVEILLPERMLFKPGSNELSAESVARIRTVAAAIYRMPELAEVEVRGHSDSSRPSARSALSDNWSLSSARAGAVANELIRGGVRGELVRAVGLGDSRPLLPEIDAAGRSIARNREVNRRVEIVLKKRKGGGP